MSTTPRLLGAAALSAPAQGNCDMSYDTGLHIQGVSKKMVFCGKTAITSFKIIQNAKSGGVLENSGYLLRYGH